jgi:hypothetical protein
MNYVFSPKSACGKILFRNCRDIISQTLNSFFITLSEISSANGAASEATIREAVTYCEREVPNYCISTTCPQYCAALRSSARRKSECRARCTGADRCNVKAVVGSTFENRGNNGDNEALDAQNRDQHWACIAERRDPAASKTGRRTTPWRELRTPSFQRAVRP